MDGRPGDDLQTFYPSEEDGENVLDAPNSYWARRQTFHEINSLSLVRLMKSSTFGLGLTIHVIIHSSSIVVLVVV